MTPQMRCHITAGFLESGRMLANVANVAAVLAGIGLFMGRTPALMWVSLLCWILESYFAIRVAIDARLFHVIAADPEERARALDEMLGRKSGRTIEDRCRGGKKLWRWQMIVLIIQVIVLLVGLV